MSPRIIPRLALALAVAGLAQWTAAQPTYVGSDACNQCHEDQWNQHRVSGHPYKLTTAADAATDPIPLPAGWDWEDISFVVGGYRWKSRYLDVNGYFITTADGQPGHNQYNNATGEWVDYNAGAVNKVYDCGTCHTTGYSAEGHQGDLPGIVGTWAFEGIQCEACHGPASDHVNLPMASNIELDPSAEACGTCHYRGDTATIPASGGFVQHHEQFNEFLASPHVDLDCTSCHDPHLRSEFSVHTECIECHDEYVDPVTDEFDPKTFKKLGQRHFERDVGCVDCHMPFTGKSAASVNAYQGDIRSHAFAITLDDAATMFNEAGTLANGPLVAAWSCLGCHDEVVEDYTAKGKPEKADAWALKNAKKIHK